MAILKFELKQQHLDLIRHLKFSLTETNHLISIQKNENDIDGQSFITSPFGGMDIFEDITLITMGKPQGLDLIKADSLYQYTQEQKDSMLQLLKELPTALEIVLSIQNFTTGNYRMKLHEGIWNKYEPKVLDK